MYAKNIKSDFAFTRNPIIICETVDEPDWGDDAPGVFTVKLGDKEIFEGHISAKLSQEINVAEIADSAVPFIAEPTSDNDFIKVLESGQNGLSARRLYVNVKIQGGESEYDCFVLRGGVSKQNLRTYIAHGEDCFSARFLNPAGNFFLTTRTGSWLIRMKETEITPLYFISDGSHDIVVKPVGVESPDDMGRSVDLGWGIYALDIAELRKLTFEDFYRIVNMFDVYVDSQFSCRIVIEEAEIAKERYRVKFRNSLGVFDIIDIVGHATESSDSNEDIEPYKRYDSDLDDFVSAKDRSEVSTSISIESMVRHSGDLPLLLDMIGSEEIYLLDIADSPVRATVSVEDGLQYGLRMEAPLPYTLKFDLAESDRCFAQRLNSVSDSVRPRVFTEQFTEQFN